MTRSHHFDGRFRCWLEGRIGDDSEHTGSSNFHFHRVKPVGQADEHNVHVQARRGNIEFAFMWLIPDPDNTQRVASRAHIVKSKAARSIRACNSDVSVGIKRDAGVSQGSSSRVTYHSAHGSWNHLSVEQDREKKYGDGGEYSAYPNVHLGDPRACESRDSRSRSYSPALELTNTVVSAVCHPPDRSRSARVQPSNSHVDGSEASSSDVQSVTSTSRRMRISATPGPLIRHQEVGGVASFQQCGLSGRKLAASPTAGQLARLDFDSTWERFNRVPLKRVR